MSFVTEGRVGLRPEITGFVIREDHSLEARLKRAYGLARSQGLSAAQALRSAPVAATADPQAGASGSTEEPVRAGGRSLFPAVQQVALRARGAMLAALPGLSERLKDAAMTGLVGLMLAARLFWRLSAAGKLGVMAGVLGLAMLLWPVSKVRAPDLRAMVSEAAMPQHAPAAEPPAAPQPAAPVRAAAVAPVKWKTIAAPIPSFNLEAPELDRASLVVKARTASDGSRQEILVWPREAEAGRKKAFFSGAVAIESYPAGQAEESLFLDVTRRAAQLGLSVERLGETVGLETKFGEMDTVEAVLGSRDEPQRCLAFRYIAQAPSLQLHGWFCGTSALPVDRATFGCVIDRLDLLRAGNDVALKRRFAEIERARKPCGSARMAVAKPGWIDAAGEMPTLKSSIRGDAPKR